MAYYSYMHTMDMMNGRPLGDPISDSDPQPKTFAADLRKVADEKNQEKQRAEINQKTTRLISDIKKICKDKSNDGLYRCFVYVPDDCMGGVFKAFNGWGMRIIQCSNKSGGQLIEISWALS